MKPKPKKNRSAHGGKVMVPAIPLDLTGRPIFPLTLGDLTIHSIGEVCYHCISKAIKICVFAIAQAFHFLAANSYSFCSIIL